VKQQQQQRNDNGKNTIGRSSKDNYDVVFLDGRHLYLRPPTKDDLPYLTRWINDQRVTRFLKTSVPMSEAAEAAWLEGLDGGKDRNIILVIVDKATGKPIGTMGLHRIDWKDRRATTGTMIGDRRYWEKGYGSEAKMLLLNYAFNTLNLHKICSGAIAFNARSIGYSKKCGYKEEGRLKQHVFKNGRYWDKVLLAVFKKDWLPIWKEFRRTGSVPHLRKKARQK